MLIGADVSLSSGSSWGGVDSRSLIICVLDHQIDNIVRKVIAFFMQISYSKLAITAQRFPNLELTKLC